MLKDFLFTTEGIQIPTVKHNFHTELSLSDDVLAWLSVWNKVQMICIWSSCCLRHHIISYTSKIQNGLPFWCRLTQAVLEKRLLNGRSSRHCLGWMYIIMPPIYHTGLWEQQPTVQSWNTLCNFSLFVIMCITINKTSGYATWFTAGGAIRIAHYDVIYDVITRKLQEIEKNGDHLAP